MYWNSSEELIDEHAFEINRNMRCIEIRNTGEQLHSAVRLIETWDVLK